MILANLLRCSAPPRLRRAIRAVALQGVVLGAAAAPRPAAGARRWRVVAASPSRRIALKGVVFPWLLLTRHARRPTSAREVEPYRRLHRRRCCSGVGPARRSPAGRLAASPLPRRTARRCSCRSRSSPRLVGLFLDRRAARRPITQVLGYLVLENGIFAFGMALAEQDAAAGRDGRPARRLRRRLRHGHRRSTTSAASSTTSTPTG
ncbi:MAG: hypothetical protein MZU95_04650 [Desulfomicrobium escambiense]|nr:hypothetical protein [Desulfomicrobium escambiense]